MKYIILILFIFNFLISFSQNEANIWYFGRNAGLDFNSGAPVPLFDGALNTLEGCATISDVTGSLLFYTDGITVWNRTHGVMLNGTGLLGDHSSTQSALIVPKPDNPNIYYIFTVDNLGEANGLQYSEVDMSLDGGLGGITANKNILLSTPTCEKITAVKNSSSNSYWVVSHKFESDEFIAFEVSDMGVSTTPVISATGLYIGGLVENTIGAIKIAPDGSKLAIAHTGFMNDAQLFDFNSSTGVVSNPMTILDEPVNSSVYGVEFSPNSSILYVSSIGHAIFQYNLQAGSPTDIINSQYRLTTLNRPYATLQLASDGRIYVAKNTTFYVDVIDNPNVVGAGCNYQYEGLHLGGRRGGLGLPPFIQSFFIIGFQAEDVCLGETTQFDANISQPFDSILWDFGDGTTSTDENPSHTYTIAGDYNVSLTVTANGQISNDSKTVTVHVMPIAHPTPDQFVCNYAQSADMDIDLSVHTAAILGGQDPNQFSVTYYDGIANYNNNVPLIPPVYNLASGATGTPIASVRNLLNPDCEALTTFGVTVLETANPAPTLPNLTACDTTSVGTDTDGLVLFDLTQNEPYILNGQSASSFIIGYYTDAALSNQINNPSAYQNTDSTETIYVQITNAIDHACPVQSTFNIEVFDNPVVNQLVELTQCDDDLDGFSVFNLNEAIDELTVNSSNETISFFETQLEAQNSDNPITNLTAYTNQTVSADTIWARVENTNGCYRLSQINLFVSTTQISNTYTKDFYECDDDTDGVAVFNFSSVTPEIESMFPAGQQLTIHYYKNQSDALAESNPILDITNYQNIGYPNTQTIYIRVESTLDNACLGLGPHVTLHVESVPIAYPVTPQQQCDDDGDGLYAFDTSNIQNTLQNGQTNITVTYTDGMGNSLPSPLPHPFLTASQSITATLINANSQDMNGACSDSTTISFIVEPAAIAYPVQDLVACDDDSDGFHTFDTTTIQSTLLNGQTGLQVSYTDANGTVLPSPLPNPFYTQSQTITAKVQSATSSYCFDETAINFVVSMRPITHPIQDDFVCDDLSNDGEHIFQLSVYDPQILNGQSSSVFEVFYFDSLVAADNNSSPLPNTYLVNSTVETVFARIQHTANPNCYAITSFELGVSYMPVAHQPQNLQICDDEFNDGYEAFDLNEQNTFILNGQSITDNSISYYLSQQDAEADTNRISELFTNTENPQTVYVRLENTDNPNCYDTTSFEIHVLEAPDLSMNNLWAICEGDSVDLIADEGFDAYLWSTGETTRIITVDTVGDYVVTATNNYGTIRCETTKNITVTQSNIAIITNIETIDWSENNNVVTVFVDGTGDYEYSLDGIHYQDSNQFTNLTIDDYTVFVRDKHGCGIVSEAIYLLFYPKFFTPNDDTYHDTWQLYNSNKEPNNKIYIYDRYGKLLKQISPMDAGWDGSFNGSPLPTSDYWFLLERQNGKTYRGHFTLKR